MGPLALMAQAAGHTVFGTDLHAGSIYPELVQAGIDLRIGPQAQDGAFLRAKLANGVDWFVHTSALPADHAELALARKAGVKCTKRDDFTAHLITELHLKLVAVAGTHGKTTTTAMIVWAAQQLHIPAAYIVGSTLSFAPSGAYHPGDQFFIYEADEYDRNFLKFHPWLAVLPFVSYDHPDIYPTPADYQQAFRQFLSQSRKWLASANASTNAIANAASPNPAADTTPAAPTSAPTPAAASHPAADFPEDDFTLAGKLRRQDAALAARAIHEMSPTAPRAAVLQALNQFPGVGRRFERLAPGFYTDYAHHPEEIAATLEMAQEEAKNQGFSGVTAVYEPHQNTRQHEVRAGYRDAFLAADRVFWLPTYLTRENPHLAVLTPEELFAPLTNRAVVTPATTDDALFAQLQQEHQAGRLIVLMSAGPADAWLRQKLILRDTHQQNKPSA